MSKKAITLKDINGNNVYPCPYYPVGSIYISLNNVNPTNFFGGNWEQIKGRFLLGTGANEANTTDYWGSMSAGQYDAPPGQKGGECRHTLNTNELARHNHMGRNYSHNWNAGISIPPGRSYAVSYGGGSAQWAYSADSYIGSSEINEMVETGERGENWAHNNMPPYLSVYMWYRVS